MSAALVLRCDGSWPGPGRETCSAFLPLPLTSVEVARRAALDAGWSLHGDVDLCPAHTAVVDLFAALDPPTLETPVMSIDPCCEHVAWQHDQHGCTVNVSTAPRAYERCHDAPADDTPASTTVRDVDCAPADVLAAVTSLLVAHQRTETSGCHCGGVQLGESYCQHVTDLLDEARLLAADAVAEALLPTVAQLVADARAEAAAAPTGVLAEIAAERARQDAKWGEQNHPDGTGPEIVWAFTGPADFVRDAAKQTTDGLAELGYVSWRDILLEEVAEAFAEEDPADLRSELVQVAAVAAQWVQAIDRAAAIRQGGRA